MVDTSKLYLKDIYAVDFKVLKEIIPRTGISRKADDVFMVLRHEHKRKAKFCPGHEEPKLADFKIIYDRYKKYSIYICTKCISEAIEDYIKELITTLKENSLTDEQIKAIAKNILKSDKQDVEGKPWALATVMV